MSTSSDAQRGADIALDLRHLLDQLKCRPRDVAAIRAWLQDHASDLKSIIADRDVSRGLLRRAAHAGHPDVILAVTVTEAGARPDAYIDLYTILLRNARIFDLNGDELDDAGIAARLRRMHDVYGLRMLSFECMSPATEVCVWHDRLECLRVMMEVDPQSRGYTRWEHNSLLQLAAMHCRPRIAEYLMQSGWSLTSHNLNKDGLSPLGSCMFAAREHDAEAICATLSQLLRHTEDAASVVRASGLCDVNLTQAAALRGYDMPSHQRARMHIYVCAAVNAVSGLPWYVLNSDGYVRWLLQVENSPSILHSLPLDEHVTTAEGVVYLRDPLRLGGITTLPLAAVEYHDGHGVQVTEAVPQHALRFAVTVDALCAIEEVVCADEEQWEDEKCMDVLRDSGVPVVTCVSPTLRHWAWMRRLHAVHAR